MKTGYTLDQLLQDEKKRNEYREKVQAANEELEQRRKSAPRLSEEDRVKIEKLIEMIRGYNDYTFKYQGDREVIKMKYADKVKSNWDVDSYQGAGALGEYERANFRARDLKRTINSILAKYLSFAHHHPDPETLGSTSLFEEYEYSNVDPQVIKIQRTLSELRNHGEEQMYQYTLRRGDPKKLIGDFNNEDLGIRYKK